MTKHLSAVAMGALVVAITAASCKCNKEEDVPPVPSATAPPASSPVELVVEEDAASEADADDSDVRKKYGPAGDTTGLKACCNALLQNSKSTPPPQGAFLAQAGAVCLAMVSSGQSKASVLAQIRTAAKGAQLPAACN